jgi:predicted membrane protein
MFLQRVRQAIYRFMYGRYGTDSFNKLLFILCLVLIFVNFLLNNVILFVISWIVLIIYFFRSFSRNIYKRQAENRKYLYIKKKVLAFFKLQKSRWTDRKKFVYRKCKNCKAIVRLPRKKGKHVVCCPKCRKDFNVIVRF